MHRRFLFLALFALASPLRAADAPDAIVRAFYAAYAAGDVAKASQFWDAEAAPAFTRKAARHFEMRCDTYHHIEIESAAIDGDRATVNALALVTTATANAVIRRDTRRTTFELQRSNDWKITQWNDREALLADRIAALPPSERAAAIADAGPLRTWRLADELTRPAMVLFNAGKTVEGMPLVVLARAIAIETGDVAALATVTGAEGVAAFRGPGNERFRGISITREAVALAERSGDPDTLGRALNRLGAAEYLIDRRGSRPTFERTMAMRDAIEDPSILAHAASYIGFAAGAEGDASAELQYGLLALSYATQTGNDSVSINAHGALAEAYSLLGYNDLSIEHWNRAVEISIRIGWDGITTQSLYRIAGQQRKPEDALRALERSLRFSTPDTRGEALRQMAFHAMASGDFERAERVLEEAAHCHLVGRGYVESSIPNAMSRLRARQGRFSEALELSQVAQRLNGGMHGEDGEFSITVETLSLLRHLQRYDEARALVPTLYQFASRVSGRGLAEMAWPSFFGRKSFWLAELVALEIDTGNFREALRLTSEVKGRALRVLAARQAPSSASLTEDERKREQALETRLAQLNRALVGGEARGARLAEMQREAEHARNELGALRAQAAAKQAATPPTPAAVEDDLALAPDEAVIQFVQTLDGLLVVGLGPGRGAERRIIAKRIDIPPADLEKKVDALRALLEAHDLRYARAAEEMYRLLLEPVRELIEPNHRLCLIPDGPLWHVPFHALRAPDGRYVADVTSIFYAPALSLADLAATPHRERRPAASLIAFANPNLRSRSIAKYRSAFSGADVGRIPEAEEEVRAVSRLYGAESRVYIGDDASEAKVKSEAPEAKVLHIATHGAADRAAPLASAMLLSPGADQEDGLLEAREILGMQLNGELAVLSSCNSGSGATSSGEGIVGLSWAFLAAGIPTTVVSQWNAASNVTSRLMIAFHRHLRDGDSAAAALRKAQNEIRRDERFRHPYYWAPFVVMGAQ